MAVKRHNECCEEKSMLRSTRVRRQMRRKRRQMPTPAHQSKFCRCQCPGSDRILVSQYTSNRPGRRPHGRFARVDMVIAAQKGKTVEDLKINKSPKIDDVYYMVISLVLDRQHISKTQQQENASSSEPNVCSPLCSQLFTHH